MLRFGPRWLERWGRRWRLALGKCHNAWSPLPIPHTVPLMMAVGKPIPVPRQLDPRDPAFEAELAALHERVVAAVQDLYERRRAMYADSWAERPLEIL